MRAVEAGLLPAQAPKAHQRSVHASPDKASFEDLRRYQLHLVASGAGPDKLEIDTAGMCQKQTLSAWPRINAHCGQPSSRFRCQRLFATAASELVSSHDGGAFWPV